MKKGLNIKNICKCHLFSIVLIVLSIFYGCSSDGESCPVEMATMEIDGVLRNFEIVGAGIGTGIFGEGTEIQVFLDSRERGVETNFFRQQTINLSFPFGRTGENLISEFSYSQAFSPDFTNVTVDFLDGEFQSNIEQNSRSCFTATFSGRFDLGNEEILIENGELVFILNDRFEDEAF